MGARQALAEKWLEPQIKVILWSTRATRDLEGLCHNPSLYVTFWALPWVSLPLYSGLWASNKGGSPHLSEARAPAGSCGALGLQAGTRGLSSVTTVTPTLEAESRGNFWQVPSPVLAPLPARPFLSLFNFRTSSHICPSALTPLSPILCGGKSRGRSPGNMRHQPLKQRFLMSIFSIHHSSMYTSSTSF